MHTDDDAEMSNDIRKMFHQTSNETKLGNGKCCRDFLVQERMDGGV